MGDAKLTEKQRRFVEAYMGQARGNATEAARLAGYKGSDPTLGQVGNENLKKPEIIKAIQERRSNDPLVLTREQLQEFWSRVALGLELDGEDVAAMRDRLKATELLGKTQALFTDQVKHSGSIGTTVYQVTIDGDDDDEQEDV
jgi:phage terminase small subunit